MIYVALLYSGKLPQLSCSSLKSSPWAQTQGWDRNEMHHGSRNRGTGYWGAWGETRPPLLSSAGAPAQPSPAASWRAHSGPSLTYFIALWPFSTEQAMSTFSRFHHSFYVVSVCGIIVGRFFFCGLSSFADSDGLPGSRFTLGTFVLVSLWGRMSILSSRVHILISKVCGQQQRHEKPVCDGSEPEWAEVNLTHLGPTDLLWLLRHRNPHNLLFSAHRTNWRRLRWFLQLRSSLIWTVDAGQ